MANDVKKKKINNSVTPSDNNEGAAVIKNKQKNGNKQPVEKEYYFSEREEKAFLRYRQAETQAERDAIFRNVLYAAFTKMVESIIRTYRLFTLNEDYETTFADTMSFLITKVNNFDVSKGKVMIGDKSYDVNSQFFSSSKKSSRIKDDKVVINNIKYSISGNKLTCDDTVYKIENNIVTIDSVDYKVSSKNVSVVPDVYPIVNNTVTIDNKTYTLSGDDVIYDENEKYTIERHKVFSYCGTICKNYLLFKREKQDKHCKKYLSYDSSPSQASKLEERFDEDSPEILELDLNTEVLDNYIWHLQDMLDPNKESMITVNERNVGNALLDFLMNWEDLFYQMGSNKFNRTSFLYFLRECTGLETPQIRDALVKFRELYYLIKEDLIKN